MHRTDQHRHAPDPVETRRSVSGMGVRIIYGTGVIGLGLYLLWYFGRSLLFLEGTGIVTAPIYDISTPYLSLIDSVNVVPGIYISEHDIVATIHSPQLDQNINDIDRVLVEQSQKEADLRIRYRIANATSQSAQDRLAMANEAFRRLDGKNGESASLVYRMDVYRERAQALVQKSQADAEVDEVQIQLHRFEENTALLKNKIQALNAQFNNGYVTAPISGIIGTNLMHNGEVIKPGDRIVQIYDMSESYIIWHVPAFTIKTPRIGDIVYVHYGQKILPAYVYDIKNIAETAPESSQSILRDKPQEQAILVRTKTQQPSLPINAPVTVRMNYNGWLDAAVSYIIGRMQ
jgi:multidrug resistance efflux pump